MAVQHHGIAHGLECPAPWVGVVIDVGNAFESQVQAADAKNLGGLIAVQQAEDVMRDDVVELAQFRRHCGIVRCNEFRVRQAEDAGVLASEFNLGIIGPPLGNPRPARAPRPAARWSSRTDALWPAGDPANSGN
ncbi:hypothetical protein G6F59_016216 [Rhizopus arrhizus]|nr:hypothetical protein G6F59_016216 [Rhizopus arrhizus]